MMSNIFVQKTDRQRKAKQKQKKETTPKSDPLMHLFLLYLAPSTSLAYRFF